MVENPPPSRPQVYSYKKICTFDKTCCNLLSDLRCQNFMWREKKLSHSEEDIGGFYNVQIPEVSLNKRTAWSFKYDIGYLFNLLSQ